MPSDYPPCEGCPYDEKCVATAPARPAGEECMLALRRREAAKGEGAPAAGQEGS